MDANPVSPAHYQKAKGIETIDYIEAVTADVPGDEAVSLGNVIKYVSRYRQKHPSDPSRDLRKARWYLDRLIEIVERKTIVPASRGGAVPECVLCGHDYHDGPCATPPSPAGPSAPTPQAESRSDGVGVCDVCGQGFYWHRPDCPRLAEQSSQSSPPESGQA